MGYAHPDELYGLIRYGVDWPGNSFIGMDQPGYTFDFRALDPGGIFNISIPGIIGGYKFEIIGGGTLAITRTASHTFETGFASTGSFAIGRPFTNISFFSYLVSQGSFATLFPRNAWELAGSFTTSGSFAFDSLRHRWRLESENIFILCLNTDSNDGPTLFTNFDFDGLCQVGETVYLASDDGLFSFSGTTDNGTDISAYFVLPEQDWNDEHLKSIEEILVSIDGGPVDVQTFHGSSYSTASRTVDSGTEIKNKRTKFGKGLRHKYIGIKISNVDGSDFKIDSIEPIIRPHKRRTVQ